MWQNLKQVVCFEAARTIELFVVLALLVEETSGDEIIELGVEFEWKFEFLPYELETGE
jgi:hypothetical protein